MTDQSLRFCARALETLEDTEMNDKWEALADAKAQRAQATTAEATQQTLAAADAMDLERCSVAVLTEAQARADAVAMAKPAAVIEADARLLHAKIAAEIATSKAAASAAQHAAAVVELHDASAAVGEAARAVVLKEMLGLAAKFTAAFDAALKIGADLQALAMRDHLRTPLNISVPMLPPEVEAALDRLPLPDQLNVSVAELRNGNTSRAWFERVAELTA
jgi:hypothetical protein